MSTLAWKPWTPRQDHPEPPAGVVATDRIEAVLGDGRLAEGLALAFEWAEFGPNRVSCWRLAPTRSAPGP